MTDKLCNILEKLRPPNFVTVSVKDQSLISTILPKWNQLAKVLKIHKKHVEIFLAESEILNGFLQRKEQQLKLEKAQLLTRRVLKLTSRWKTNDFWGQMKKFQDAMGKFTKTSTRIIVENSKTLRLPSSQWCAWVIYLALRDVALLAKIKFDCENATRFWLGLISSSHHWGDSLLVTGILSRLWHLSSTLVEKFVANIYPALVFILDLLQPTKSVQWPDQDWKAPRDLLDWLRNRMFVPFEPANMTAVNTGNKPNHPMTSLLSKEYINSSPTGSLPSSKKIKKSKNLSASSSLALGIKNQDESEDFGTPVVTIVKPNSTTRKSNLPCPARNDWKPFRKYWRIFFKDFDLKLNSSAGRRGLLANVKKYKLRETDKKLRVKLIRLKKCLKEGGNASIPFQKFQSFIQKRTKLMRKASLD